MINAISEMLVGSGIKISLELLLKGHQQLSEEENTKVFREVQLFISDSNRFSVMFDLSYFVFFYCFLFVPPRLAFYLLLRSIKVYIKKNV